MPSTLPHREASSCWTASICASSLTSISKTSHGSGKRLATFCVRLTARPKFVRTISAPCSCAEVAAAYAIDCGVSTPVISSLLPSSNMVGQPSPGPKGPQRRGTSMRAMDLGIEGKVALVTAASAGLGLGCAGALAAEGCRVAINGHDAARLEAAGAMLGNETLTLTADVTEADVPDALVASTVERFGALDILVANAPGPPKARSLEVTDDALLAAVEANFLTSVRLVR